MATTTDWLDGYKPAHRKSLEAAVDAAAPYVALAEEHLISLTRAWADGGLWRELVIDVQSVMAVADTVTQFVERCELKVEMPDCKYVLGMPYPPSRRVLSLGGRGAWEIVSFIRTS